MRTPFWTLLLLMASSLLFVSSCNKDDDDDRADVSFEFNYLVDGQDYDPNTVYTVNGTAVRFDVANFYVGGIGFMPEGETEMTPMDGKYLLVTPDVTEQSVGKLDPGRYDMISFFVGVGPDENNQSEEDFSERQNDPNDPLAEQDPRMHWNWMSGYRFIRIDGEVDTDGDGTPDQGLEFHLGRDEFLETLQFTVPQELESGTNIIRFTVDLAQLFDGIDISTNFSMHTTPDEMGTATLFAENVSKAITL